MPNHNARQLRKNLTDTERMLWVRLRKRQLDNYRFRRQYPIGPYIVDFICLEARLAIELDGRQHYEEQNQLYDQKRTDWLNIQEFSVIRFSNSEVFEDIDSVVQTIYLHLTRS